MNKTAWVDFKAVRDAMDFTTVLLHYGIGIHGSGEQVKIVCPFHDDHKPSCGVNIARGVFNCFSCEAKGNVMEFVARMEGYDPNTTTGIRDGALAALDIMKLNSADFRKDGQSSQVRSKAKPKSASVTKQRAKATVQSESDNSSESEVINPPLTFELDLEAEHAFFEEHGISADAVCEFGLGYTNKGIMKGRICIPLHNELGELVAYAGRHPDEEPPENVPRYKLPKGFQKSHLLFNAHRAFRMEQTRLFIVEGYWSAMRLHLLGLPVVATMGASLSDEQVAIIRTTNIKHVVVIFDGDEGGRVGAKDAIEKLVSYFFSRRIDLPDGVKPDTMSEETLSNL